MPDQVTQTQIERRQSERRSGQDRRAKQCRRDPEAMIDRIEDDVLRRVTGMRRSTERRQGERRQN